MTDKDIIRAAEIAKCLKLARTSQAEIGRQLGVSRQAVNAVVQGRKATKKIRDEITNICRIWHQDDLNLWE